MDHVSINECPVSFITPRSAQLVQLFYNSRHVREETGATLFGPDLGEWPTWAYDAARIIQVETILESNARVEAENAR